MTIQDEFCKIAPILTPDHKITILKNSDWGGIECYQGKFKSFEYTEYAQYKDAVKITFRQKRRRSDWSIFLYDEFVLINGWPEINIPRWTHGNIGLGSKLALLKKNYQDDILIDNSDSQVFKADKVVTCTLGDIYNYYFVPDCEKDKLIARVKKNTGNEGIEWFGEPTQEQKGYIENQNGQAYSFYLKQKQRREAIKYERV